MRNKLAQANIVKIENPSLQKYKTLHARALT